MGRERSKKKSTKCKLNLSSAKDLDMPSFQPLFPPASNPHPPSLFLRTTLSVQAISQTSFSSSGWLLHHPPTPTSKHSFSVGWYSSFFIFLLIFGGLDFLFMRFTSLLRDFPRYEKSTKTALTSLCQTLLLTLTLSFSKGHSGSVVSMEKNGWNQWLYWEKRGNMTGDAKRKYFLPSQDLSHGCCNWKCTYGSGYRTSVSSGYIWLILRFQKIACQIHKNVYPVSFISPYPKNYSTAKNYCYHTVQEFKERKGPSMCEMSFSSYSAWDGFLSTFQCLFFTAIFIICCLVETFR